MLTLQNNQSALVKGALSHLHSGEMVTIQGTWTSHPKFGRQFEAQHCTAHAPTSLVGLKKYLSSGLVKGIGPVYAEKLVDHFGTDVLTIIDAHPEKLHSVPGIGTKRAATIIASWKDQKEISNLMVFLQDKGITPALAARIYKQYRSESLAVLLENPFRIADEMWGIGFKTADEIAGKLGFQPHAPQRIASGILFVISTATQQGHLYVELQDLKSKTLELLTLKTEHEPLIKNALHALHNKDKIKLISEKEKHYLTLSSYYFSEKGQSPPALKSLIKRNSQAVFNISDLYNKLRVPNDREVHLNEDQQKGIISCLQNKVTIITGGPGTGKTTLIKKLLSILDEERVKYKLAAPTGRAAKRIIEGTGKFATTIHRLLEFDGASMKFTYNEYHALKLDFLIIDEASMIDIFLAHAILKAVP